MRFTRLENSQPPLAPGIADAAFVRFTSGTTGAAKGVVLTHRDVLERTRAANAGLKLTHEDKILWVLPMAYHFYVSIILYLEIGSTVIVSADYLAGSLLETAAKHAATFLYITPMHVRMMNSDQSGRALPPSLKRVMSVSAKLHPQSALDFLAKYKVPVAQGYGIIEVGLPIQNNDEAAEHPEAIGRPVEGFEAKIVDDKMQPHAEGETGQLALRGPGMFSGYLNPPRSRAEILHDGWFLTGDLAHRDSGGRIVLDGRTSSVIHVAGHKVFPEEVAAVLDHHPAVLRSRVSREGASANGRGDSCRSAVASRPPGDERGHHRVLPKTTFVPESAGHAGHRCGNQNHHQRQSPARLNFPPSFACRRKAVSWNDSSCIR